MCSRSTRKGPLYVKLPSDVPSRFSKRKLVGCRCMMSEGGLWWCFLSTSESFLTAIMLAFVHRHTCRIHLPKGSGTLFADLCPSCPTLDILLSLPGMSPGLCESLLLLLALGPTPFMALLIPFIPAALGGCIEPSDGFCELINGDGEDREDRAPFGVVCTAGSEGRFSF